MNGSCVIAALSQRISQSGQDARMGGTDPVALFLCFRSEWPHSSSSSELEVKPQRKATMKTEDDPLLSIGDVAQRSGVKASALRFYESLNLIESVRSASGHRRYHRSSLRRIAFVVFAQDRKSTRLNSSHLVISYAVLCLKKKQTLHVA